MKIVQHYSLVFLLWGLILPTLKPSSAHAGIKESWYMYRGRENMEIKNYKAAIEAYEKAIQMNSSNREASRGLGLAYENQGLIDKAVGQYDTYLSQWSDDHEVALRQARLLKWSRYSYRQQDAIKYYRMSLRHKEDPQVRLEYADVLASKKETSDQAIAEYNAVLKANPRNAAAHRGLAKAYAWNGDQDHSLYHTRLAREYGDQSQDTKHLESSLEKDRRPEVGIEGLILNQTSSREFALSGIHVGAYGHSHLSPFLTAHWRGGGETFWNDRDSKSSGYFGGGLHYRLSPEKSWLLGLTYHGMSVDGLEADAAYQFQAEASRWKIGVKRELIYDSYLALVGKEDSTGKKLGAARRSVFYVELHKKMEAIEIRFAPFTGWISAQSVSPNLIYGADLDSVYSFSGQTWALVGYTGFSSYQKDYSGFQDQAVAPFAGGYFSPSLFFSQDILLRYQLNSSDEDMWSLNIGPSYQYVRGTSSDGSKYGARLEASFLRKMNNKLYLKLLGEARQVADVYTQIRASAWLSYEF
ncbi:MAG: tetratricopeptide repeat protein [Pseudobdellovibrionaceae bacterium]